MDEKKTNHEEAISRSEFFGVAAKKTKEMTLSWVEKILSPLTNLGEEESESAPTTIQNEWIEVAREEEITSSPKMVIRNAKGFFVFKGDGRVKVIRGMCPNDSFAMTYLSQEDGLYCANCQVTYYLIRESILEEGKLYSNEIPAKVEDGKVYILLEDSQ
jgi:nitrite reductase/ring-hydroxylating ferredoxin subunit